jgi:hypothetical protein
MSEAKPAARVPATKKTGVGNTLKVGSSIKDIEKKDETSTKSIKEKSSGDLKSLKQSGVDKSSKSLLIDGVTENSSPKLSKKAIPVPTVPVELTNISSKLAKQLQQLAIEFEGFLNQELNLLYNDPELKAVLEKSHNYSRVQECLLSSGLLGVSSAFTALQSSLSQYKSLMRNKSKRDCKEMPTTATAHKTMSEGIELEIKAYFGAKLKEEDGAKKKGIEILTTGDFDKQKFERALSASSLRNQSWKAGGDGKNGEEISRQRLANISPVSFSTVTNQSSPRKQKQALRLAEEVASYKESFELNFQKAFNFKPLDAIYAVRPEFNDPLNTLTICGFSINSKGKIMDYSLGAGTVSLEHSNDCRSGRS